MIPQKQFFSNGLSFLFAEKAFFVVGVAEMCCFVAERLVKFTQKLFLSVVEVTRHVDNHAHQLIAAPAVIKALNTFAFEFKHIAGLRACRDIVLHFAVKRRHL